MKTEYLIGIGIAASVLLVYLNRKPITNKIKNVMAVIPEKMKPIITQICNDAKKDGVNLMVVSGLRTFDEQLALRKSNVIDKTKINDRNYLLNADNKYFSPITAKPSTSNHESGIAFDFNVTGNNDVFLWLVEHGIKYGFVRTVPSEKWHWEYRPNTPMFAVVPKSHQSWIS